MSSLRSTFKFGIISITGLMLLAFFPKLVRGDAPDLYNLLSRSSLEILINGQLRGSGWFVRSHGMAITAAHVVKDVRMLEVLSEQGRLQATVVATDPGHDLALIKVERPGNLFHELPLATNEPRVGETIYCYGSILNRHNLMIEGKLAAADTRFEWNGENKIYSEVYPLNAMTPVGLSGAPWVNASGEVVGVQSGMMIWKDALAGTAFMSPLSAIRHLFETGQSVHSRRLGVTLAEPWEGALDGIGPGRKAGLRIIAITGAGLLPEVGLQQNEIIYALDGKSLTHRDPFLRDLKGRPDGSKVQLSVGGPSGPLREVELQF